MINNRVRTNRKIQFALEQKQILTIVFYMNLNIFLNFEIQTNTWHGK